MLRAEVFDNAGALAKLAALNPVAIESVTADGSDAHGRKEGRRTVASSSGKVSGAEKIGGTFTPTANPAWLQTRLEVLESIAARNAALTAKLEKPKITVTLPDGKKIEGTAWTTSPLDIATGISKGLAQAVIVASVRYTKRLAGIATVAELVRTAMHAAPDDQRAAS